MGFRKIIPWLAFLLNIFALIISEKSGFSVFPMKNYVVTSTYLSKLNMSNARNKRSDSCVDMDLKTGNQEYKLCLLVKTGLDSVIDENTTVLLYNNVTEEQFKLSDLELLFVGGYVVTEPFSSSISGYIESESFYGRVSIFDKMYYVENIKYFRNVLKDVQMNGNAIVYEGSEQNLAIDIYFKNDTVYVYNHPTLLKIQNWSKLNDDGPIGYVCNLIAIIDRSFLKYVAFNNVNTAMSIVISSIESAEALFRSTDFDEDGTPDNIGIRLVTLVIEGTRKDYGVTDYINKYVDSPIDGKIYLNKLSKFPYLPFHCLGIGFTAQPFINRVIGLSFTAVVEFTEDFILTSGGICDVPNMLGECHNTLVVTYSLESGIRAPQFLADLSLIHELGHSFGSDHDNMKECSDHIMASHTYRPSNINNLAFSRCSKQQILKILRVRASCFEVMDEPFCGNGIVEAGEDCDCGHPMTCKELDQCCIPRGSRGMHCKVNSERGFSCHPTQGLCCLSNCQYRNVTHLQLNCKNIHRSCPCPSYQSKCKCGLRGVCLKDECHSLECARIGLRECQCPLNMRMCQTCCQFQKECRSALEVTKEMMAAEPKEVYEKVSLFEELDDKGNGAGQDILESICWGGRCIQIYFKMFNNNDYCLYKGKLSTCERSRCNIPTNYRRNVFPNVEKSIRDLGARGTELKLDIFLIICLYLNLAQILY